jgi:hypothetical protein
MAIVVLFSFLTGYEFFELPCIKKLISTRTMYGDVQVTFNYVNRVLAKILDACVVCYSFVKSVVTFIRLRMGYSTPFFRFSFHQQS